MKKMTTDAGLAGQEVKMSNSHPAAPIHPAPQPQLEKRSKDPSSTCQTSSRYPIPSLFDGRVWGRP